MQLVELPPFSLRTFAPPTVFERSEGCHVTDVTGLIMKKVDPKRYGRPFDPADSENWQEAGFLWEDILGRAFADRAAVGAMPWGEIGEVRFRPGEVERDGIVGSPDALAITPLRDVPIIEEYKATWKSMGPWLQPSDPDGQKLSALEDTRYLGYLLQLKSYCTIVGTTQARLIILFLNGDYTKYVPQVRGFELTFTPRELNEHWTMIKNTARKEGWL